MKDREARAVRRIEARTQGCGPLIPSLTESARPLRQQIFERVRAAGYMPRVQVAKELGVSPASVTTLTSELIEMGGALRSRRILARRSRPCRCLRRP
jgi:hypothetical protein